MDRLVERIFVSEIRSQCKFALGAFARMRQALADYDLYEIFASVQAFLGATGNLSKLLWPLNASAAARGDTLRKDLSVPEDSPIQPRTFRNHFEHFDERLERWATESPRRNFVDMNVMPPGTIAGIDVGDFMRNLDPQTLILSFRGDSYELRKIEAALRDLLAHADKKEIELTQNRC